MPHANQAKSAKIAVKAVLLAGICFSPPIFAQTIANDTATAEPATSEQEDAGGLTDIVVTATRRNEVSSRVPISISAYGQERLDQLGITDFSQVARQTPGIKFDETSGNISIRGIASNAGASTTGVYIDDTPIQIRSFGQKTTAGRPTIFDLDRIEVLRGPQGTLFGAGSQGGTVRYITPQPSLTDFSVYARGEFAATEKAEPSFEAGVAVGGPIVEDKVGFRVSIYDRRDGGWVDHVDYHDGRVLDKNANWSNSFAVRGALAFAPAEGLLITPAIDFQRRYINDTSEFYEFYSDRDDSSFASANPAFLPDTDKFILPSLKIQYDGASVSFISNTSYFKRDQQGYYDASLVYLGFLDSVLGSGSLLAPSGPRSDVYGIDDFLIRGSVSNRQRNFTQEVRLQSNDPDAKLSWVLGAFYSKSKQSNVLQEYGQQLPQLIENTLGGDGLTNFLGVRDLIDDEGLLNFNPTTEREEQIAGFANVTWAITNELKLSAGVRGSIIDFSFDSFYIDPTGSRTGTGSTKSKPITPKFNVSYQVTPEHMVYATAAKGFRVGGINAPLPSFCDQNLIDLGIPEPDAVYDSDSVWSYEIGAKGRVAGGRVQYAASAYRIDWSKIQQTNSLSTCGYQYIDNLGQARAQGFDFQGSAKLGDIFTAELAVGYTDAKYTKTTLFAPSPLAAIAVNEGNALPGVVPWTVVVGGMADFDVAGRSAYARVNYEFSSRGKVGPVQDSATGNYDPNIPVTPPTHLVRLRAGMEFDNLDVALFVDNLFNAAPQLTREHRVVTQQLYTNTTFRPRTAGITVTYRH